MTVTPIATIHDKAPATPKDIAALAKKPKLGEIEDLVRNKANGLPASYSHVGAVKAKKTIAEATGNGKGAKEVRHGAGTLGGVFSKSFGKKGQEHTVSLSYDAYGSGAQIQVTGPFGGITGRMYPQGDELKFTDVRSSGHLAECDIDAFKAAYLTLTDAVQNKKGSKAQFESFWGKAQ